MSAAAKPSAKSSAARHPHRRRGEVVERVARMLELGEVMTMMGGRFEQWGALFSGDRSRPPSLALYYDRDRDTLFVIPFGSEPRDMRFLPFNFMPDPRSSEAKGVAKTQMLVLAGGLRSGAMPELESELSRPTPRSLLWPARG